MKKVLLRSIIAITLAFSMIAGVVVHAWQYDYDVAAGKTYDVGYWNTDGQANWTLHINREKLPMTIYLTRTAGSLGWNYPNGTDYITTSEKDRKLTVYIKSGVPLGNNIINIDANIGGRVYIDFFENIAVNYSSGKTTASNMPSNTTVKSYGTITLASNTPTATGYTFKHWLGSDGKTYSPGATVTVNGDVSFTAQWDAVNYTIGYTLNGGSVSGNPTSYNIETATFTLKNPTKTGYTFTGWTGTGLSSASTSVSVAKGSTGNRSYTANWTPTNYTISYNLDGGSVSGNPTSYNIETATFTLKNPTKTGYTFAGWTGTGLSSASTSVSVAKGNTGNRSYTATWTANTYTVNYDGNGATSGSTASQTFTWDESKELASNGFKRIHTVTYNANGGTASKTSENAEATFNGWEDRNSMTFNGTTYSADNFDAPYYANTYGDLYNAFGYNKYKLVGHFDKYITHGTETRKAKDPNGIRSYYYASRLTVANLTTVNGGSVTMHANWTPKSVTLPTATRTGYTFKNWLGSNGTTYAAGASVPIASNMTFTAQWTPNIYKVTLDNQSATTAGTAAYWYKYKTTSTVNGETIYYWTDSSCSTSPLYSYKITVPTKTGYTFGGYWTGTNGSGTQYVNADGYCINNLYNAVAANTTLYAKWTPVTYTISYNLNGGSVDTANPTSYTIESNAITLNNPKKDGYTFAGWTGTGLSSATTSVTIAKGNTGNRSYTATWTPNSYTVKFNNVPGGTGTMANQTYKFDTTYNLPANAFALAYTLTYDGNGGVSDRNSDTANATFNGWEDRGTIIVKGTPYLYTTFDAPFYANVNGLAYNKYNLITHYLNNGGAGKGSTPGLYPDKAAVSNLSTSPNGEVNLHANFTPTSVVLPNASRAGYTFDGWLDGSVIVGKGGATYTPSANETLTAKWTPVDYAISYDLAGGTATGNPTSYNIETETFKLNNPTKKGYIFAGWTGTGLSGATESVSIAKGSMGDRAYTATWKTDSYSITYDLAGGSVSPANPESFTVETAAFKLNNPTKTGYTFDGWTGSNGVAAQTSVTVDTSSAENKTYKANWKPIDYKISYDLAGGSDPGNPTTYNIESETITLKKPTKENYEFIGWTGSNGTEPELDVTIPKGSMGDKAYTANFTLSKCKIRWVDHDGTLLAEDTVKYGDMPSYTGAALSRESTAEFEYKHTGWTPEITAATADATYKAVYTATTRKYSITFRNEDGSVLETKEVEYGKTPTYTGATPTKEPTETEVFTFAGWGPGLDVVTGEAEYVAVYTSGTRYYTVIWKNGDTVLETDECEYNAMPTYDGETPLKVKDETNAYKFKGWSPEVAAVTTDITYVAEFDAVPLTSVADLVITTSNCKEGQSYVFKVESIEDPAFVPIEVAIIGNGSAVIKDVVIGNYKVTEEDSWTWRYLDGGAKTVSVELDAENEAVFENIKTTGISKWLSGLASLFIK